MDACSQSVSLLVFGIYTSHSILLWSDLIRGCLGVVLVWSHTPLCSTLGFVIGFAFAEGLAG